MVEGDSQMAINTQHHYGSDSREPGPFMADVMREPRIARHFG
jgi:hypothetical protein